MFKPLSLALLAAIASLPVHADAQTAPPAKDAAQAVQCGQVFDARTGRLTGPATLIVRQG